MMTARMTKIVMFLCVGVLVSTLQAGVVVTDDFEDGNWTANPTWTSSYAGQSVVGNWAGSQRLLLYGHWDANYRSLVSLGFDAVPENGSVTIDFDLGSLYNPGQQDVIYFYLGENGGSNVWVGFSTNAAHFGSGGSATGIVLYDNGAYTLANPGAALPQSQAIQNISISYDLQTDVFEVAQNGTNILTGSVANLAVDTLYFKSACSSDSMCLDNVSVDVVPEPASLSLLCLGGIAALIRRKR